MARKFQIKVNNEPILFHQLNEQAYRVWDLKISHDVYADPSGENRLANWVDSIGWHIANPQTNWTSGWANIKCSMFAQQTAELGVLSEEEQIVRLRDIQIYLQPYYKLIDYWHNKGYTPHKID